MKSIPFPIGDVLTDIGLYDSRNGNTLITEKAIDITEKCPLLKGTERALLLFTTAEDGRIVQICRSPLGKTFLRSRIHFFVDSLEKEMAVAPRDDTFGSWALRLGLSKQELRELIETSAPTS